MSGWRLYGRGRPYPLWRYLEISRFKTENGDILIINLTQLYLQILEDLKVQVVKTENGDILIIGLTLLYLQILGDHKVQVVRTENGDILIVTCDDTAPERKELKRIYINYIQVIKRPIFVILLIPPYSRRATKLFIFCGRFYVFLYSQSKNI